MSERIDEAVAALRALPGLVALVDEVPDSIAFQDWYSPLDHLTTLFDRMIGAELKAASPKSAATVRLLLSEAGPGWDLMATWLTLDTLESHPELLVLFVERLRADITAVLEGGLGMVNRDR